MSTSIMQPPATAAVGNPDTSLYGRWLGRLTDGTCALAAGSWCWHRWPEG